MAKKNAPQPDSLLTVQWKRFLRAPDGLLLDDLYVPALSRAVHYDRCCAYFSSRILAVAARGFGGFIDNLLQPGPPPDKPAARLLVNEQLDPQDLDALMATGGQERLVEKLLQQFKTPQDALEARRLEMLAGLVAEGWVEVRVGVMARTRGIVHAKFGVITDRYGDAVAFMGSDNETGQALVENYEELEVRPSWEDPEFVDNYRQRFEALWENRDAHVRVFHLPDAVRARLIQFAPSQPSTREPRQSRAALTTAMLWHLISAAAYLPGGEYACDATAMVDLWPHQVQVVEDTSRSFPAGRLLCDEVGMGKTIEAMQVLRRLLCGRGVERALLLVPAGLLGQWQGELREKGGLLVPYWDRGYLTWPNGERQKTEAAVTLAQNDVLLLSREWARLPSNGEVVLNAPAWDIVLLDEAHAARRSAQVEREFNSANLLLQLMREFQLRRRTRGILLLSATPMQTCPWEPWDLLAVLGVGGNWMIEFSDVRAYYQGIRHLRREVLDFPRAQAVAHLVATDAEFPPLSDADGPMKEEALQEALTFGVDDLQRDRYARWLRRGAPLGRRMHRNTRETLRQYHARGLLKSAPPQREVQDEIFDYRVDAERDCYEAIADYIDSRYEQLEGEKPGKGFVMTVYRRRLASSPLALRRSLARRVEKLDNVIRRRLGDVWWSSEEEQVDERDLADAGMEEQVDPAVPSDPKVAEAEKHQVEILLERLNALGSADSKLARFWQVLKEVTADGRAALVFTEYTDTLEYLRDQLRPTYGQTLGCYSGAGGQVWDGQQWTAVSKAEITERLFRSELRVLVCTDAASEGLNLQAAGALINYDLPWNPSKVEQRIGRIDRIGQKQPILPVRNLFLDNSVDVRVYELLRDRCGLFKHFVGRMQPVLSAARDVLRRNPRPAEASRLLELLKQTAAEAEADESVASTFVADDAEPLPVTVPPVTRQDIEQALARLEGLEGKVKAKRSGKLPTWRLVGLGRGVQVTTDLDVLERDPHVLPMALGAEIVDQLARSLQLPLQIPLVLQTAAAGPYRCTEARWVGPDRIVPVVSAQHLLELADEWDGLPPPPDLHLEAQDEAQAAARKRVGEMQKAALVREQAGLERQLEAARGRILRELGRTLRCFGDGDLDQLFHQQVQHEGRPDGRYHTALKLLGSYPRWTREQVADAESFVQSASAADRKARLAGSEVDAAIGDPRWKAKKASVG